MQAADPTILESIHAKGWAARLVPETRRFDVWNELADRHAHDEFDDGFFDERLRPFEHAIREAPEWIRSILIVAIPDPMLRIRFRWRGREIALTVPPTFLRWEAMGEPNIERVVREQAGEKIRVQPAGLPKKLLATRSGLARYGRNNITYVEGMGSYHRLCALYTDLSCDRVVWQEPTMLDACAACGACARACPTGAIDGNRFLVRAERCITFWQEKPADVAFPADLDLTWGDQFIGCMRCQDVCPQNAGVLMSEEIGPPFTEEETAALLRGSTVEDLSEETVAKLAQHDILEYLDVLPRNLRSVIERASDW